MRCSVFTKSNLRCKNPCYNNSNTCFVHSNKPDDYYCKCCKQKAVKNQYCAFHYTYEDDCPICLEKVNMKQGRILHCNHVFHVQCLTRWFQTKYTCPMCRTVIPEERSKYLSSDDFVSRLLNEVQSAVDEVDTDLDDETYNTQIRSILNQIQQYLNVTFENENRSFVIDYYPA